MGADPDSWAKGDREFIYDIINRGARRAYYPDNLQDGSLHKWSFLTVRFQIQTKTGVADYVLPDDCGGVIGNLSFDSADSGYSQVVKSTPQDILKWRSINTDVSSYPERYAEEFFHEAGTDKQTRRLMLWPTPAANYSLNGMMDVTPGDMNEERPYGYGGDPLVETLLASMLSLINPEMESLFQQRLRAAFQHDLTHNQPEFLGKNSNGRKGWAGARNRDGRFTDFNPVTYSG